MKIENGTVKVMALQAIALSPNVVNKPGSKVHGKYILSCVPNAIFPKGNFALTAGQLNVMAGKLGLTTFRALPVAISKGDVKIHITARYNVAGCQSPDDASIVFTENHWSTRDFTPELGTASADYIDKLTLAVATANETKAVEDDNQLAADLRIKNLLSKQLGNRATAATADDDDFDLDSDDEETPADDVPSTDAKGKKK